MYQSLSMNRYTPSAYSLSKKKKLSRIPWNGDQVTTQGIGELMFSE